MAGVQIDKDELERFVSALRRFDRNLSAEWRSLNLSWKNLEGTWHDHERDKFLSDWQNVIRAMEGYLAQADRYEQFLIRKDRALADYLGR